MRLSRQPRTLEEIERAALQVRGDTASLERLKRKCVLYAGRPGAMKRRAQLAYTRISEMIKQCQEGTHQETADTPPSTPSGSQKEAQVDSSRSSEISEDDAGK